MTITPAMIATDEASRTGPTFLSYFENSGALLARANSAVVNIQSSADQVFTTGLVRQCAANATQQRSDPLGLYQSLSTAPMGYGMAASNAPDETGLRTYCRSGSASTGMGSCVSCFCNKPAGVHSQNSIYGKDSFVVTCLQGEAWGCISETQVQVQDTIDLTMGSMLKSNIFLGSICYERANFYSGSGTVFHNEAVGFPLGFQSLRVGFNVGNLGLHHLASYFEEGSGKFCNFFIQCHNANGKYQVVSPTVEYQGTEKNASISVSIADKSSDTSILWALLVGFAFPPFWQKAKKYVHKKRRADLQMIDGSIHIRVGDCFKTQYLKKIEDRKNSIVTGLEGIGDRSIYRFRDWYYLLKRRKLNKAKATVEAKIACENPNAEFIVSGRAKSVFHNVVKLRVPHAKKDSPYGGTHLSVEEEILALGGFKQGPDVVVDNKNHTIKIVVGPYDAPPNAISGQDDQAIPAECRFQLIEITEKGIYIRVIRTKEPIKDENRVEKLFKEFFHDDQACASISLRKDRMQVLYQGDDAASKNQVKILLKNDQLFVRSKENIEFSSAGLFDIEGSDIKMKASQVKVNGSSVEAI